MQMIRRVVTGNDTEGRSYIVSDELVRRGELWRCGPDAPLGTSAAAAGDTPFPPLPATAPHIEPPAGGSNFVYVSFPPWSEIASAFARGDKPGFDQDGFHRTATVDYLFILDGEIELLLDEGSVTLRAGDAVIQRNTRHAWRNHSDGAVHFLAVMVRPPE